jgi:O-antigen/teichoic acid export membrane protein
VTGQLAEGIVYPLVFIALLAGALAWTRVLAAAGAMALNGAALLAALVCAAVLARHVLPASVRHAAPGWRDASWAATIAPLVIVSGVQAASGQIPVLIAGAVGSAEMAGVLSVAKRLADLAALPAIAAGAVLTPALARAWATRDLDGFQRAFTHFARGVTLATLPLAIGLIVFRAPLLGLFGASFARGGTALVVLCVGHVANVAVGSVSLALVMADHEREAAWIGAAAALLNAALCAVAVPRWGIEGAAAAAVVTLIVWNVWLAVRVWRLLGIRPTILARTRRRDVTG